MTFRVYRYPKLELSLMIAAVVVLMAAFSVAAEPPYDRTEYRQQCANYDPLKQPFFGETHLHTAYSFDASTLDTRNTPRDAYFYARGGKVGLPPWADTRCPGYLFGCDIGREISILSPRPRPEV